MKRMKTFAFPDDHKMYVVTVKVHKNPAHDRVCNVSNECSDATGEHHSYVTTGRNALDVLQSAQDAWGHVTRVEEVSLYAFLSASEL